MSRPTTTGNGTLMPGMPRTAAYDFLSLPQTQNS
jgi:hypothetical protein